MRVLHGLLVVVSISLIAALFRPGLGHCYTEEQTAHSPLYGVVLTRALNGIRGQETAARETPAEAIQASYNPRKPANEQLTDRERDYLVPSGNSPGRVRQGTPGAQNPTGKPARRQGSGADWAKSIALMKRVKQERALRRRQLAAHSSAPLAAMRIEPVAGLGAGIQLAPAPQMSLVVLADVPTNVTEPTAQPGHATQCWLPPGTTTGGGQTTTTTTSVSTACYVADGTAGGTAVSTSCYTTDGSGNSSAVATQCYSINDTNGDGQDDGGNHGGTGQATACYSITDDNNDGQDDGGNHGGEAHSSACYSITDENGDGRDDGSNHGGEVNTTACYSIVDNDQNGRDDNGNHGGVGGVTACYAITDDNNNGRDDNGNHGGEGGSTVCYTIEDTNSNGRDDNDDHGGDANPTACYAITDEGDGAGGAPDGRDDEGNHGGLPQETSCWTITDSDDDGNDDGGNHGGNAAETMCYSVPPTAGGPVGGEAQPTACYTGATAEAPGGTGQDTVCYTLESPSQPGGDANETACYDVTPNGLPGGSANETLCYTFEGNPDDAKQTPTKCYLVSANGDVGGESFGDCITDVITEVNNTATASDDFVPLAPPTDVTTRLKWDTPGLEADVDLLPNSRVSVDPNSVEPLTDQWSEVTVGTEALSTALNDAHVVVKALNADDVMEEVGRAKLTVYKLEPDHTPRDDFAGRSTTELGLAERTDLSWRATPSFVTAENMGGLVWDFALGLDNGTLNYAGLSGIGDYEASHTAPVAGAMAMLRLTIASGPAKDKYVQLSLTTLRPAGVRYERTKPNVVRHIHDRASAGIELKIFLLPKRVSFTWCQFQEGEAEATVSGYFVGLEETHPASPAPLNILGGDINKGSEIEGTDRAWYFCDAGPYSSGTFVWPIPQDIRPVNEWTTFATMNQTFVVTATGKLTVRKGAQEGSAELDDPTQDW